MDANPRRANLTPKEWLGLAFSILLFVVSMAGVCPDRFGSSSTETHLSGGETTRFQAIMEANARYSQPGVPADRTLNFVGTIQPGPVTAVWYPPPGAYDFTFEISPIDNTPPFVWQDYNPANILPNTARFRTPSMPPGQLPRTVVDSFTLFDQDWNHSTAVFRTTILSPSLRLQETSTVPRPPASPAGDAPAARAVSPLWFVEHTMFTEGVALTQSMCQDWATFVQSDDTFLALQVPISPTAVITESYPSPVVFWGGPGAAYLMLMNFATWQQIFAVPLDLRPDRLTFLENAFPSADDEAWIALGGNPATVNCPAGLSTSEWGFTARGRLDLSFLPAYGAGRTLPLYYCYEGQEIPPVFASLLGDRVAYQGEGITCLGPQALPLIATPTPPLLWDLRDATSAWITPTQSISIHHQIAPGDFAPFTVSVTYESDLGVQWGLYGGDADEPNLGDPITAPLPVTGFTDIWLVSDPLPADTAHGGYGVVITATNVLSPADLRWAGDVIWVGDWVAPSLPPPTYPIYLPLLRRNF